eukprot:6188845-Pleurochrysis_carterae.AAC.4
MVKRGSGDRGAVAIGERAARRARWCAAWWDGAAAEARCRPGRNGRLRDRTRRMHNSDLTDEIPGRHIAAIATIAPAAAADASAAATAAAIAATDAVATAVATILFLSLGVICDASRSRLVPCIEEHYLTRLSKWPWQYQPAAAS